MGWLTDWFKSKVVDAYSSFINWLVSAIVSSFSKLGIPLSDLSAKLLIVLIGAIIIVILATLIKSLAKIIVIIALLLFLISIFVL